MELDWPNWSDWGSFGVEAPVQLSVLQFLGTSASPGAFSGAQTSGRACSSGAENERTGAAAREEEKLCKDQSFELTVPALGTLPCCGFCLVPPVGAPERPWQGGGGAGALPAQPLPPQLCPRRISALFFTRKGQAGPWWQSGIAVVSEEKVKAQKVLLDFGKQPQG